VSELLTNHDEGSLFKWSSNSLTRLKALKWNGDKEQRKRVPIMVGYLVELVYDISIARDNTISGSPAFELPLGGFPPKKRESYLDLMMLDFHIVLYRNFISDFRVEPDNLYFTLN
jgi:hypothetical protein